ncbi:sulfate/molybdate ABC transporter ATP-binding protein [Iodidimonas nitroreducens]|nr:ATP-binding cassette domain-containing protein [Iodidimonas nitroreducens]
MQLEPGAMLALVGHSGAGKTTILRTIAGLYTPAMARLSVSDDLWLDTDRAINLPPRQRRVGMVFQSYALFPHMSAIQNVACAIDDLGSGEKMAEAERLLALVNLKGLEKRKPAALSNGQQQRVALARALARRPKALLLDEPFAALDRRTREGLYGEIIALRHQLRQSHHAPDQIMPIILVTHDMHEAERLADQIMVIEDGQMIAHGPVPDVLSQPEALRAMGIPQPS